MASSTYNTKREYATQRAKREQTERKLAAMGYVGKDVMQEFTRRKLFCRAASKALSAAVSDIAGAAKTAALVSYGAAGNVESPFKNKENMSLIDDLEAAQRRGIQLIPHLSTDKVNGDWKFMNDFKKKQQKFEELMKEI